MSHDDFHFEPVPGLPAALPAGERLLWQGTPEWKALAVRAYHVRKVALYFLLLMLWRAAFGVLNGHTPAAIWAGCLLLGALGATAIGVLGALAYFSARSTVYSITTRRVLIRHGVAVPMTLQIPFQSIEGAAVRRHPDGTGEIALAVPRTQRVGYLISWPHLRPGRFAQPQPSLRALRDAEEAAQILAAALEAEPARDAAGDGRTPEDGARTVQLGQVPPSSPVGARPRAAAAA